MLFHRGGSIEGGGGGGECTKCARKHTKKKFPATLTLGTFDMTWNHGTNDHNHEVALHVEITILRHFVATAVNIKAFVMQEQGDYPMSPTVAATPWSSVNNNLEATGPANWVLTDFPKSWNLLLYD